MTHLVIDVKDDSAVDHPRDINRDEKHPDELGSDVCWEATAAFLYRSAHVW